MTYNQQALLLGFIMGAVYAALRMSHASAWILMPVFMVLFFLVDYWTSPE